MKHDLSIIIPFYKKYSEFLYAIKFNSVEYELAKEVIIVFDEIINTEDYKFLLTSYPNINFKFYMNIENHEWRNPVVTINHGIKNSNGEYIIVLSPETILLPNFIDNLIKTTKDDTFTVGLIIFMVKELFINLGLDTSESLFEKPAQYKKKFLGPLYYGSICCKKKNFEKVNYYSEQFAFKGWGGDDDDVRSKLIKNNIKIIKNDNVKAIHNDSKESFYKRNKRSQHPKPVCEFLYNNFIKISINRESCIEINKEEIEINKEEIEIHALISSIKQNTNIIDYKLKSNIKNKYNVILLAQCYNEEKHITEFMNNVSKFVDGIIVLDDSSTDNSWNLLEHEKILLKYRKNRLTFNDLENRNSLLDVLSNVFIKNNIQINWIFWLDFDERIENENLKDIKNILNQTNYNIFNISFIHMWSDTEYNANYPYSNNGIQPHTRIFRNNFTTSMLPYKITSSGNLHFQLVPYRDIKANLPILIKHLGRNSKELRNKKFKLYTQEYDIKNIQSYDHFIKEDNWKLIKYDKIKIFKEII